MVWILSTTTFPLYKLSTISHRLNSFPTRPSRLAPVRLTESLCSVSFFSRSRRNFPSPAASGAAGEDLSEYPAGVIVIDVRGMACEGCVTSVKNILESQPQVSSASVDLATATAIIRPAVEDKVVQDWQTVMGINLAKHLTSCGFESTLQRVT